MFVSCGRFGLTRGCDACKARLASGYWVAPFEVREEEERERDREQLSIELFGVGECRHSPEGQCLNYPHMLHINGNAAYAIGDSEFRRMLTAVQTNFPR